jgi:N-acetylglucosamine malate deacetylase 1
MMRILALGAHPDDIEIYMFGTLSAARAQGAELALAIATDGARGGMGDGKALALTRAAEARAAAALLGVEPRFLAFPDGALVADASLVDALRMLLAWTRPDLIITHAPNDYHGDHRALSEAVRLAAGFSAPVLFADTMGGTGFVPTHYVDVTGHFPLKAQAIRAHASQDPERFLARAESLNAFRAGQCNAPAGSYAEAFRFEPVFPFADIRDLLPPAPPVRPVAARDRLADTLS